MSVLPSLRRSSIWKRTLLPVAVTVAVTMILLSVLEAKKSERRLPPQVAFIPSEAHFLAVTSSLNGLWRNLGNHSARFRDPKPGSYWDEVNNSLRDLSIHCIAFETAEDLSSAGLDPARGLSVALMGSRPDMLATVPVRNADQALKTLGALFLPTVPIRLSPSNPDSDVAAFVVRPQNIENAVLCAVPTGAPFQGSPQVLADGIDNEIKAPFGPDRSVELYLASRGPGPARLDLSCQAVLLDGTRQPCDCDIDYGKPCDRPYTSGTEDRGLLPWTGDPTSNSDTTTVWTNENNDLYIGFVDQRMVIASRPDLVGDAADRRGDRATRLLGDNALLGLVDQFHADAQAGDATVLGLLRGIEEPVIGSIPFSIAADPDHIRLRAALPLDTFGFEVLESLIAHPTAQPPGTTAGTPLAALVNDPAAGTYFTLIDKIYGEWSKRWAEEQADLMQETDSEDFVIVDPILIEDEEIPPNDQFEEEPVEIAGPRDESGVTPAGCTPRDDNGHAPSLYDKLGNFEPLVRGLAALEDIGPLEGYLLDLRDGVPEVVLVQRGLAPARMERLIDRTRDRMKLDRDIQVLCGARADFWRDQGGQMFPVEPGSLVPYLGHEATELLQRYSLQEEYITRLPDAAEFDFDIPAYRDSPARFEIGYVPPPVSDLDLQYRFDASDYGDLDTEALRNNAFRLAYARLADGAVAFGTDAITLNGFLGMLAGPRPEAGQAAGDKLLVEGNPEHLVTLGLLYPQDDIRSLFTTGGFEVLDQYRSLRITLRPAESFDGLAFEAELAHD